MHNLQIEQTPIHALKPQDRNARIHSKRQIRQIADSMRRFGFNNPILTDDSLQIIAGHGRHEAAKLLGMTTFPSIRLSHMSATEKRAYIIADNEIALKAGWDRETLAIELQGLIDLGFEVELIGFEPADFHGPSLQCAHRGARFRLGARSPSRVCDGFRRDDRG